MVVRVIVQDYHSTNVYHYNGSMDDFIYEVNNNLTNELMIFQDAFSRRMAFLPLKAHAFEAIEINPEEEMD